MDSGFHYYKKAVPDQRVIIASTGKYIPVEKINHDLGVVAARNPVVIDAIERQIAEHKGGWEKISEPEYQELLSKKNANLSRQWRDEWPNNQIRLAPDSVSHAKESVAAVPNPLKPSSPTVPQPQKEPEIVPESFRPTATKRPT